MKKKAAYPGALGKPFNVKLPTAPNYLCSTEAWERFRREVHEVQAVLDRERAERWRLLRDFHGLATECSWKDVAETLAAVHVPGLKFQEPPKVGRKPEWSADRVGELKALVKSIIAKDKVTVLQACAQAKKIDESFSAAPSTLKKVYHSGVRGTKNRRA